MKCKNCGTEANESFCINCGMRVEAVQHILPVHVPVSEIITPSKKPKAFYKKLWFWLAVLLTVILITILQFALPAGDTAGLPMAPNGYNKKYEYFDNGANTSTVYCKYTYKPEFDAVFSGTYKCITPDDLKNVSSYFENFVKWLPFQKYGKKFDFDKSQIEVGDYYFFETKEGDTTFRGELYGKYDDYTLYFYDTDTHTLYYIHMKV